MARGRTIKPEFFRDKLIGRLGATVGMVYQALWCWADDGGVCRIEPDVLKGECFMRWPEYTTGVLTDCLAALHGARRIVPYEVDGELYAELPNLAEHSPINHPSKFRYPRGGEAVTDIRAWLTGQYTPVALREPSAPISHLPLAMTIQTAGAAKSAAPVVGDISPDDEPLGAWYGRVLKPLLLRKPYPAPAALHDMQSRDISILGRQLKSRPRADIEDAVREMREQAEDGQLAGWVEPGQTFTLRAMVAEANGGIATFERFRHAAVKRREIEGAA